MRVTLTKPNNAPNFCFELVTRDDSILFQSDWEYTSLASNFGFVPCPHGCGTDGTVSCPHYTASEMISLAFDYLETKIGQSFDDPGYFDRIG